MTLLKKVWLFVLTSLITGFVTVAGSILGNTYEMVRLYSLLADTWQLPIVYAYQPGTAKFQSGLVCAGTGIGHPPD